MAKSVGSAAKSSSRRCFTFVNVTTPTAPRTPLPTKFAVAEKHKGGLLRWKHYICWRRRQNISRVLGRKWAFVQRCGSAANAAAKVPSRAIMVASPDTFAWPSGIRSSTLSSEFNLLLPIVSWAAPHDQQVSCHALLLQVKDFPLKEYESHTSRGKPAGRCISGTESDSGNTSRNEFRWGRQILLR